jgi:hypothetical protein
MHIMTGEIQLIPFNTVCGCDTAHYTLGSKTYSFLHCLWLYYWALLPEIYNLIPSTMSVVVILRITAGDIQLIPVNIVCGCDTVYYSLWCKTYSIQHCLWWWYWTLCLGIYNIFPSNCLWWWYCTLQPGIYNLCHSKLSVVVILLITALDQQLIHFNTVCGCDTAYYS